jgi:hypothetical protein
MRVGSFRKPVLPAASVDVNKALGWMKSALLSEIRLHIPWIYYTASVTFITLASLLFTSSAFFTSASFSFSIISRSFYSVALSFILSTFFLFISLFSSSASFSFSITSPSFGSTSLSFSPASISIQHYFSLILLCCSFFQSFFFIQLFSIFQYCFIFIQPYFFFIQLCFSSVWSYLYSVQFRFYFLPIRSSFINLCNFIGFCFCPSHFFLHSTDLQSPFIRILHRILSLFPLLMQSQLLIHHPVFCVSFFTSFLSFDHVNVRHPMTRPSSYRQIFCDAFPGIGTVLPCCVKLIMIWYDMILYDIYIYIYIC